MVAEEAATDFMRGPLTTYRGSVHDDGEDTAVEWIGGNAFRKVYDEA